MQKIWEEGLDLKEDDIINQKRTYNSLQEENEDKKFVSFLKEKGVS